MACIRVPPARPGIRLDHVRKHDQHIARAALHYDGLMLTSDAPLVLQARADAILATFPWSIVVQFDGANAADILRIVPPDRKTGSIFARTTPGGWLGLRNVGTFTVVDIEHVGRLAFDTAGLEWTFSCSFGLTVRLPYVETARGTTVVSVSYNLRRSGVRGQVVLRAARFGGLERPTISETTLGIHTRPAGGSMLELTYSPLALGTAT